MLYCRVPEAKDSLSCPPWAFPCGKGAVPMHLVAEGLQPQRQGILPEHLFPNSFASGRTTQQSCWRGNNRALWFVSNF